MARSFLNTDWEKFILGVSTEKLITRIPDALAVTIGKPSPDIELDSFRSSANKRTKVSST